MSALAVALIISPLLHAAEAPVRIGLEQVKIRITRICISSVFTFSRSRTASPLRMLSLTGELPDSEDAHGLRR